MWGVVGIVLHRVFVGFPTTKIFFKIIEKKSVGIVKRCIFEKQITIKPKVMTHSFILKFGKYKGQNFNSTPISYQSWLLKQDWFKLPAQLTDVQKAAKTISQLSGQLKGWNGYSRNGAAIYDAIFDAEVALDEAVATERKYYGMNEETKQAEMDYEFAEINACNKIYDYYND